MVLGTEVRYCGVDISVCNTRCNPQPPKKKKKKKEKQAFPNQSFAPNFAKDFPLFIKCANR